MLTIALAQDSFRVGQLSANRELILERVRQARDVDRADLIVFPELALTGYPPGDLLLRPESTRRLAQAFGEIVAAVYGIDVVLPWPRSEGRRRFSSAAWIREGSVLGVYDKWVLGNDPVSDEQRYFSAGDQPLVVEVGGVRVGLVMGEDTRTTQAVGAAAAAGADIIVSTSALPFYRDRHIDRAEALRRRNAETGLPLLDLNCVGGQDELVFDGHSLAIDAAGNPSLPAPLCASELLLVGFGRKSGGLEYLQWPAGETEPLPVTYRVLQTGLRDYAVNNGFASCVLGLSGDIDSALTAALAADALGADAVHAVMMPARDTREQSLVLATEQVDMLGIHADTIPIEPVYQSAMQQLSTAFDGTDRNRAEKNLQARARAMLLAALSDKFGHLVLASGNKSELAVGFGTLYSDLCGGFSPLKDCLKGLVYRLAIWRNGISPAIPDGVILRPPATEPSPDQIDRHELPPYPLLDSIIEAYAERAQSVDEIAESAGIDEAIVRRVAEKMLQADFKRRQCAPGVRITQSAFGRDRRNPITSGWRDGGAGR